MTKKSENGSRIFDKRVDIIPLVSCTDSLLQMDPDTGERRMDSETGHALTTPQCITQKLRQLMALENTPLFLTPGGGPPLELLIREMAASAGLAAKGGDSGEDEDDDEDEEQEARRRKPSGQKKSAGYSIEDRARFHHHACQTYKDIRMFGGAITSPVNHPIPGAASMGMMRSVFPVSSQNYAITRQQVTSERETGKTRVMGRMATVPYELTKIAISINPFRCAANGFTYDDYEWLKSRLPLMFDNTRSAIRFNACVERMYFAEHDSQYGNLQTAKFLRRIKCTPKLDKHGEPVTPRSFDDVDIELDDTGLRGVKITMIEC